MAKQDTQSEKLWTSKFTPKKYDWSEFLYDTEIASKEALKTFISFGVIILNNASKGIQIH